jgi:hypothetical protein
MSRDNKGEQKLEIDTDGQDREIKNDRKLGNDVNWCALRHPSAATL